jgi:hypothetical protein
MAVKAKAKAKTKQEAAAEPKSELVVTKISPKGINAVIKNVILNWVFLAKPAEDKKNPLKAAYRTQMILRGGEKEFIVAMEVSLTQYLKSAAVTWGGDIRTKVLKNMLTLDAEKALFKTDASGLGLSMQTHQTVKRETELDEFAAARPPKVVLSNGEDCPHNMIATEFYSGVIADVAVFIQTYEADGGRGVTLLLNGVRKVANGERIAGIDPFAEVPATTLLESGVSGKQPVKRGLMMWIRDVKLLQQRVIT